MRHEKKLIGESLSDERLAAFREKIKGKTLMDDRFMSVFFKDFPEGVELVLNTILERNDLKIINLDVQLTMTNLHGRSIRIDVLAKDDTGILYNIEVQKADKGAGFKRARYHSSMLDSNAKEFIGENDFDNLPKTIVIFICENDIMKKSKPLYKINRYVKETGEIFEDDAQIIYVNGKNRNSSTELGRLMQDFFEKDPDKMNNRLLADKAKKLKSDREGLAMVREYLTEEEWNMAIAQGTEQGIAQGKKLGIAQEREQIALNMINVGINMETIINTTGLSEKEINKLLLTR